MQKLDLNYVGTEEEIKMQINNMKEAELLSEEEIRAVEKISFARFFKSSLGKRLIKAYNDGRLVKRELPFYTEISSLELEADLPKEIYRDEKIRLQGIIDCFFEEEDGIVLFDYKTDYVERGNEEKILDRYKMQIKYYYKEALEKITGKPVKECYLYLFGINKEVEMKI